MSNWGSSIFVGECLQALQLATVFAGTVNVPTSVTITAACMTQHKDITTHACWLCLKTSTTEQSTGTHQTSFYVYQEACHTEKFNPPVAYVRVAFSIMWKMNQLNNKLNQQTPVQTTTHEADPLRTTPKVQNYKNLNLEFSFCYDFNFAFLFTFSQYFC